MDGDRLWLPANRNCYRLSRVSWALLKLLVALVSRLTICHQLTHLAADLTFVSVGSCTYLSCPSSADELSALGLDWTSNDLLSWLSWRLLRWWHVTHISSTSCDLCSFSKEGKCLHTTLSKHSERQNYVFIAVLGLCGYTGYGSGTGLAVWVRVKYGYTHKLNLMTTKPAISN